MKPILIFSMLLFLMITSASAQFVKFHVGATSGVNSTIVLDKGLSDDPRYNSTYTYQFAPIGFNFGVDLAKKFGISLEGIKAMQGQVYQILDAAKQVKGERKIELSYFHLPMLLKFMGGGMSGTRANFNIGPQLSFISAATESMQAQAGTYTIPEGKDFSTIQQDFPTAVDNGNGTYNLPNDVPSTTLYTSKANDFKNTQFSIAAAFGVDFDLAKHLYLTTQIRSTYSLSAITNGEVAEKIKSGNGESLIGEKANIVVGVQIGLHYMFGSTRKFMNR